jgi:hypothetical protein
MAEGTPRLANDVNEFLASSAMGDDLIAPVTLDDPRVTPIRTVGRQALYRRRE